MKMYAYHYCIMKQKIDGSLDYSDGTYHSKSPVQDMTRVRQTLSEDNMFQIDGFTILSFTFLPNDDTEATE